VGEAGPVPVVYVIGTLDRGGAERQVMELATRLDRKRFAAHVFCLSVGGPMQPEVKAAGIPVTVIGPLTMVGSRSSVRRRMNCDSRVKRSSTSSPTDSVMPRRSSSVGPTSR